MTNFMNHRGYSRTFQEGKLTLSMIFPLESYEGNIPEMDLETQVTLAKRAEAANFASLFVRDIPLNDPMFGDVGQMYDPWIFLSYIASQTTEIALGTASSITSFQHPLNLAKSASSLDKISGERLLLGLATGDRPVEFEAFGVNREKRAEIFRESYSVLKDIWAHPFPTIKTENVSLHGELDFLPKPTLGDIPTFVTGFSGQSLEWIAQNSDGWLSYPRNPILQKKFIQDYRLLSGKFKPFAQSLHIDLLENPNQGPTNMHLGFRSGSNYLKKYLYELEEIGVNHVIISTKDSSRPAGEIIDQLAEEIVPCFPAQ